MWVSPSLNCSDNRHTVKCRGLKPAAYGLVCLLSVLLLNPHTGFAQTVRIALNSVVTGLTEPVYLTSSRDGTDRRFIIEQPGRISVVQPGSNTRSVFLDITSRVLAGGERGLLGLAFHPQYASNRRFFVNYTRRNDGATVIAEYAASAANSNVADTTERVLLVIAQPYPNHNGGMIEFGPDGYLYIGMGDGGSGNDPENRAQNLNELLGKMLRIDINPPGVLYSSPASNPFYGSIPGRDEIYAVGLRNPWRFSFDRATGQLYAGDVGQSAREEVDIITLGGNYGWRVLEGTVCTNLGPAGCSSPGFIGPITQYVNGSAGRCSITGGYVYRGAQQSLPYGAYIFADYCTGEIFMFHNGLQSLLLDTAFNISSFGEDEAGELYVVSLGGTIYRISNPDAVTATSRFFNTGARGISSWTSAGQSSMTTGYARIQAGAGGALPAGMVIFGYRQNGILVSEASVPAMPVIQSGRIYAETSTGVRTGIAIANPNPQAVTVSFYFTDLTGANQPQGSTVIPANQQIAAFLDQSPFNGGSFSKGTFSFTASALVSALALRGFTPPGGEFLMTTLPVVDQVNPPTGTQTIPQVADGEGWVTTVVLVNPTDAVIGGTLQAFGPNGQSLTLSMNGQAGSQFTYSIPPRTSSTFQTAGIVNQAVQVGSVRITPTNGGAPSALAIFRYSPDSISISEAGAPAVNGATASRMFVENAALMQSGLAVANTSSAAASVNVELIRPDGTPAGVSGSFTIPANGHTSYFLTQLPGFAAMPSPFQGLLRLTSTTPIAITGLRTRYNERGAFLVSTTAPIDEASGVTSSELLFPHFAVGAGYEMQFVMFTRGIQPSLGTVYFYDREGRAFTLPLR